MLSLDETTKRDLFTSQKRDHKRDQFAQLKKITIIDHPHVKSQLESAKETIKRDIFTYLPTCRHKRDLISSQKETTKRDVLANLKETTKRDLPIHLSSCPH